MKFKALTLIVVAILITGFTVNIDKDDTSDYDYLKERLKNTKVYTVETIKAMPDSDYIYKPTKDVRSYAALACHIVYSIEWNIKLMKGTPIKWEAGDEDRFSKDELIKYANEQFDSLIDFIGSANESPELTNKIIDVLNHNAHHRGQMTTYLRMKSVTPPNYR